MNDDAATIVQGMMRAGYASELLALLLGESSFNRADSPGAPTESQAVRLRSIAISHLKYVAITGRSDGLVEHDGKAYSGKQAEFGEWIAAGLPGVTLDELRAFAAAHPDIYPGK